MGKDEIDSVRLGNVYGEEFGTGYAGNVWDSAAIAPTMMTMQGGGRQPMVVKCVAMRGRGSENNQQLEVRKDAVVNELTTVQKDNMVIEQNELLRKPQGLESLSRAEQSRAEQSVLVRQNTKSGLIQCNVPGVCDLSYPTSRTRRGRVIENGNVSPTLTTENIPEVLEKWIWEVDGIRYLIRIRKLTPRECFRLMSFSDEDFSKAESVNSNTQLYKQAGNSIVEECLKQIFRKLI